MKQDGQSDKGWPWIHLQISYETSTGGSRSGAYVPTSGGGNDDQKSLWRIWYPEWYLVSTKRLWTLQTKKQRLIDLVISTLTLDDVRNLFILMLQRARSSLMWSSSIGVHITIGTWSMAPCDTWALYILDMSLWESSQPENWAIISISTGLIYRLISMISTLVWDGNLHTATAYGWTITNAIHYLWGNWRNKHFREKTDRDWNKGWWSIIEFCQRVTCGLLHIVSGLLLTSL